MSAPAWHGIKDVRVDTDPDPVIRVPTDAIVRVTSTAICGCDLHLYKALPMYLEEGDVLGHEPKAVVEEVSTGAGRLAPGDRVVVPFSDTPGTGDLATHGMPLEAGPRGYELFQTQRDGAVEVVLEP